MNSAQVSLIQLKAMIEREHTKAEKEQIHAHIKEMKRTSIEQFNGPKKADITTEDLPRRQFKPWKPLQQTIVHRPGSLDYREIPSQYTERK
jgi:hypothetical protein